MDLPTNARQKIQLPLIMYILQFVVMFLQIYNFRWNPDEMHEQVSHTHVKQNPTPKNDGKEEECERAREKD